MLSLIFNRTVIIFVLLAALCAASVGALARASDDPATAGTVISNRAEATYEDTTGASFSTVSPTITFKVLAVSTLVITPDETEPSSGVGPRERITRVFRICNTGNTPDLYTITRAEVSAPARLVSLHFDTDRSDTLTEGDTPVRVGVSLSPRLAPGACIGVIAEVLTEESLAGSRLAISLAARSNITEAANGMAQDEGTIITSVGNGARFSDPNDPNLPPAKLVEGRSQVAASSGQTLTYTIAFRNSGDVPANRVKLVDELPEGLAYESGSLRLGQRPLTDAEDADEGQVRDRRIEVRLERIAPAELVQITFRARVTGQLAPGTGAVNFATLAAENVPPTETSRAVAVINPFGTIYAARSGGSATINDARISLLTDQANQHLLTLAPDAGFTPNERNENPFTTAAGGRFSFRLTPEQLGLPTDPARYFLNVTAQGYRARLLEITLLPTGTGGLYQVTVRALDGQPIARSSASFELINETVQLENLASLALNIPMFEQRGLEITKSADRPRAEIGDAVAYRVEVHNPAAAPINDVVVRDRLPASFNYVKGTARLSIAGALERAIEPEALNGELVFRTGEIPRGATARILYRVRVGANAREGEQQNLAVASGVFPTGERDETAPARASVMVGGGVFSTRQAILGRVFVDVNGNNQFDAGDRPVPNVRLYLNSGQSAVTDSEGLYNFPSLGDGAQVIALDPITLPQGYALNDGGSVAGRSWTRLLRTPVGGGALLRQNFALTGSGPANARAASSSGVSDALSRPADSLPALPSPQTLPSLPAAQNNQANASAAGTNQQAAPQPAANQSQPVKAAYGAPKTAGTYEFVATETIDPVAPGDVRVLTPTANAVVMSPAMQLEARVALNWTVKLEVNGDLISAKNIGATRLDQKNQVSTFAFVGINLHPGPNHLRITPISPDGVSGRTEEMTVMGRGPVRRLEISAEKTEIQAGGRDLTAIHVRAFDQWGSPASDGQVGVEASMGQLLPMEEKPGAAQSSSELKSSSQTGVERSNPANVSGEGEAINQARSQLVVSLEGGEAVLKLIAAGTPGEARLHAQMGKAEARASVRITPESRPTLLVGLAEVTAGQAIPEATLRGEEGHLRSRLSFFYHGNLWQRSVLTLAYDSQRPINRTAGRDRLFQLDPLDRVYPLFGDSSTRYEAAQSNSKLYARLDHGRSYLMFGDFEADMENLALTGYARKLTGVKLHAENSQGDFVTVTGARPDTSFARDVFPGGQLGVIRLSHGEILPGSETLTIEVRDRRNPEVILSRETLARSVDYSLNPVTGEIFFLRYISTFDHALNLVQVVATYEHRNGDMRSAVYTARATKNFAGLGLRLGLSAVVQQQADFGSYVLGGIDGEKSLPRQGALRFAYAQSRGELMGSGNFFGPDAGEHDGGNAYQVELEQPLSFYEATVRARYSHASPGFFNPFGATVTPGSRRGELSFELKPRTSSTLRFGLMQERNQTRNVDNTRLTLSAAWEQVVNDRLRFHLGYDHRSFKDDLNDRITESNLITAGAEVQVTDKLRLSVKREQNLNEADPTYPNQTTLAANYEVNNWTRLFFTQRLAAAPIMPIGDVAQTGFAATGSRRETAIGVETRFGKHTALNSRYQLENGINGTDSFAVIGLQNSLPLSKELSLELGFERGFHLAGQGVSFNSATVGFGWQPNADFRASTRYEFRDRGGIGQLFVIGAAGRITEGVTALSRFQMSRGGYAGRSSSSTEGMAALAIRPLKSDRAGLLFSYNHRSLSQDGETEADSTRDRIDTLSTDGYYQATEALELYGRLALRFGANGQADLPFVSTLTYLAQARAQYRLTGRFDWAGETRLLMQPSSGTRRTVYGTELGFWALPDLRLGVGYNFTLAGEPQPVRIGAARRGFYFTISSKLSNLFDLFGTSRQGLAENESRQQSNARDQR